MAEKRTIAVAGFPYRAKITSAAGRVTFVRRFARRGETVELFDPADVARGDNNGHFVKPGETVAKSGQPPALDDLGLMTDEQLVEAVANSGVKKLLKAIGKNEEIAQRVLEIENTAGHAPRATLVNDLEKLLNHGGD